MAVYRHSVPFLELSWRPAGLGSNALGRFLPFLATNKPGPSSRLQAASPRRSPRGALLGGVVLALGGREECGRFIIKDVNKTANRVIMEKSSGGLPDHRL
jgi:hypothetical protein